MRYQLIFNLLDSLYLICIDVNKYVSIEDITEFLNLENIKDKESLERALNNYVHNYRTDSYEPHWFYDKVDTIISCQ